MIEEWRPLRAGWNAQIIGELVDGNFQKRVEEVGCLEHLLLIALYSMPPLDGAGGAKNLNSPDNRRGAL